MAMPDIDITDDDINALEINDKITFDSIRSKILKSVDTIDVQACPGSGKTTLIASKLILLSQKWPHKYQGVCVLSHTNVAKDQIIKKLKKSSFPEAQYLLSYPHFIGTIQDFVDRYLALPVVRELTGFTKFLEREDAIREVLSSGEDINSLCGSLYHACGGPKPYDPSFYREIKQFISTVFWLNENNDIGFYGDYGRLKTYIKDPTKKIYPKLEALKNSMVHKGLYQYRDMYVYARKIADQNSHLGPCLQKRFPFVFIDEMQDTQKFQDDLLLQVFPLNSPYVSVQRFGDPDQAIFHGINDEVPNESYNTKSRSDMNFVIDKSHRFDSSVCKKIKKLSFNEIDLDSDLSSNDIEARKESHVDSGSFKHTVFIYNNETITHVIPEFAKLCAHEFREDKKKDKKFSVKSVGAVGNEIDPQNDTQLKIGHYWNSFEKNKSKKNFKEECLIDAIYYVREYSIDDLSLYYKILNNCILKLLRISKVMDEKNKFYNASTLKDLLVNKNIWRRYRKVMYWFINDNNEITSQKWQQACNLLIKVLNIDSSREGVGAYLEYRDIHSQELSNYRGIDVNIPNIEDIKIELSTIHGVKGETHDATLVLETKNQCHDLAAMMPYLTGDWPNNKYTNTILRVNPSHRANVKANQKFMRQLYVAMSRPRHLLCCAIHRDRITPEDEKKLDDLGWTILEIEFENQEV